MLIVLVRVRDGKDREFDIRVGDHKVLKLFTMKDLCLDEVVGT